MAHKVQRNSGKCNCLNRLPRKIQLLSTRDCQHVLAWTKVLRKRSGNFAHRKSWTARDDEFTFTQQLRRFVPLCDPEKCIDAQEKIEPISFAQPALELPY